MAESNAIGLPRKPDELILEINNQHPLNALDLSALFGDLARDYRRFSGGRELSIVRLEYGSLTAILADLAGMAQSANILLDFATRVAGLLDVARNTPSLFSRRKAGGKTVVNL